MTPSPAFMTDSLCDFQTTIGGDQAASSDFHSDLNEDLIYPNTFSDLSEGDADKSEEFLIIQDALPPQKRPLPAQLV